MAYLICASRGPRIGDESPRCKRALDHPGPHMSDPEDGWRGEQWGAPTSPDLQLRADLAAAGVEPYWPAANPYAPV